jgi:hypothetical protein
LSLAEVVAGLIFQAVAVVVVGLEWVQHLLLHPELHIR